MTQPLVLSLFPGIGLLDMAFEQEGFCVVRGPDCLWGGDVRRFHPPAGKFDGVIGGPPCQAFSKLSHMVRHNGLEPKFGNLIPEFERCVLETRPLWWLMENVPDAPVPFSLPYEGQPISDAARAEWPPCEHYGLYWIILNNRQCFDDGGEPAKQHRARRITFGYRGGRRILPVETAALENPLFDHAAIGGSNAGKRKIRTGKNGKTNTTMPFNAKSRAAVSELLCKQGLPSDFTKHWPFTVEAACKAIGNGVPLPMGRAIARAVKEALKTP